MQHLTDDQVAEAVTRLVRERSSTAVARDLDLSRFTVLAIVARTARRGSLALARDALRVHMPEMFSYVPERLA